MKLDEYLQTVTDQIRWSPARDVVGQELKDHIQDQAEAYEAEGISEAEALEKAVQDMGDPVEVGVSMDRLHRPCLSVELLLLVGIVSLLSIAVHAALVGVHSDYAISGITYLEHHIGYVLFGYVLMLIIYRLDYTILARMGKLLAGCCLGLLVLGVMTGIRVNGAQLYLGIGPVRLYLPMLFYLYLPCYVGVLYRYRQESYRALAKIAVWTVLPVYLALRIPSVNLALILCIVFLVTFSAAVWRNWYQVNRKAVLATLWLGTLTGAILSVGLLLTGMQTYQVARIRAFLTSDPDYNYIGLAAGKLLQKSYLFGENVENVRTLADTLPGYNSDYIFVSLISAYGILAGVLVLALLLFLILKIFRISLKQRNQLGTVLGISCGTVFLLQLVLCIGVNLNLLPASSVTLPFFSAGGSGIAVSYILLGLVFSIYRYKDIPKDRVSYGKMIQKKSEWV